MLSLCCIFFWVGFCVCLGISGPHGKWVVVIFGFYEELEFLLGVLKDEEIKK